MKKIAIKELKESDKEIKKTISPKIEKFFCRVCGNIMKKTEEIYQGYHNECKKLIRVV